MYVAWNLSRYSSGLFCSVRQSNPLFIDIPHWKAIFWVWLMNHLLRLLQRVADFFYYCSLKYIRSIFSSTKKHVSGVCEQQRRRPACKSAQSDHCLHCLCYLLSWERSSQACSMQNFSFLASLCSQGDWFESRFCHDEVHIIAAILCITLYCHDSCV